MVFGNPTLVTLTITITITIAFMVYFTTTRLVTSGPWTELGSTRLLDISLQVTHLTTSSQAYFPLIYALYCSSSPLPTCPHAQLSTCPTVHLYT